MIKFFRKIRKQLLGENKTGKYLKYAIGEIMLVMIGILLALQVNNWNERQKLIKQTKEYEDRLINDIIKDTLSIKNSLPVRHGTIDNIEAYFEEFETEETNLKKALEKAIAVETNLARYVPVRNTFEDLKSTGNLNLLTLKKQDALIELAHYQDTGLIIAEKLMSNYFDSAVLAEGVIERRSMVKADGNSKILRRSGKPFKRIYEVFGIPENREKLAQGLIYRQNMLTSLLIYHRVILRRDIQTLQLSRETVEILKSDN